MHGFLAFLNHWWNLPYLVMLGLVAAFFLLQLVGVLGHHGDHDVDHGGHDHHHDHDAHGHGHDAMSGDVWHSVLAFFGVGKVPFMVVWLTMFIFAGFSGLIFNRVVYLTWTSLPGWVFPVSLLVAIVVGLIGVRLFARAAGKVIDLSGKPATSKRTLAGKPGVVASALLDATYGEVRVHDGDNEIIVHGRVQGGEGALKRGDRVVLVEYDEHADLFWITASPDVDAAA
jgi:hypothetical protein